MRPPAVPIDLDDVRRAELIAAVLPHRAPLLLISRVLPYTPDHVAVMARLDQQAFGLRSGNPVVPRPMVFEALAQAGAFAIDRFDSTLRGRTGLLCKIPSAHCSVTLEPAQTDVLCRVHIERQRSAGKLWFFNLAGDALLADQIIATMRWSVILAPPSAAALQAPESTVSRCRIQHPDLPYRSTRTFVDSAQVAEPAQRITAFHRVTAYDCRGHFHNQPVYPGVYTLLGCKQAAELLLGTIDQQLVGRWWNLDTVVGLDFCEPIRPGALLRYSVTLNALADNRYDFSAEVVECSSGDTPLVVAKIGSFTLALSP